MATVGVKGLDLEIHINSRSSLDLLYTTVNNSLDTHVLSNKMTAYKKTNNNNNSKPTFHKITAIH